MKIAISRAAFIVAASVVTAKDDGRVCLNGILIEKAKKGAYIVATDGHRLLASYDENAQLSENTPEQVVIRFERAPLSIARKKANLGQPLFIAQHDDSNAVTVDIFATTSVAELGGKIIDGTFPDWRQVCNFKPNGTAAACYNVDYLADWKAVSRYLTEGGVYQAITIRAQDKASAAAVFFAGVDYAFGLVMPMREAPDTLKQFPSWV